MQQPTRLNETKPDNPDRDTTVLNRPMSLDMNDVLREKVAELQRKLYKGQQTMYEGECLSNETHVQDLNYCEHENSLQEKWGMKEQSCDNARPDSMDETVPVRDLPLKKVSWFHL